jgi:hypothetical protein
MGMLDKLKQLVEEAQKRGARAVDASQFNHPVAGQTEWHPLKPGGANFQTHRLDDSNPDLLVFKATTFTKVFCGIFAGVGALGIAIPLLIFMHQGGTDWGLLLFAFLFGGIFLAAGLLMYYFMATPRVFDTFYGCYYKGRKKPEHTLSMSRDEAHAITHLNEVVAIQVISERISSKNGSYHSYEINLVKQDGSRINVVDHGKPAAVITDAEKLATQLGLPLWDAS